MDKFCAEKIVYDTMSALIQYDLEELECKKEEAMQYIKERDGGADVRGYFDLAFDVAIKAKREERARRMGGTAI